MIRKRETTEQREACTIHILGLGGEIWTVEFVMFSTNS